MELEVGVEVEGRWKRRWRSGGGRCGGQVEAEVECKGGGQVELEVKVRWKWRLNVEVEVRCNWRWRCVGQL